MKLWKISVQCDIAGKIGEVADASALVAADSAERAITVMTEAIFSKGLICLGPDDTIPPNEVVSVRLTSIKPDGDVELIDGLPFDPIQCD